MTWALKDDDNMLKHEHYQVEADKWTRKTTKYTYTEYINRAIVILVDCVHRFAWAYEMTLSRVTGFFFSI